MVLRSYGLFYWEVMNKTILISILGSIVFIGCNNNYIDVDYITEYDEDISCSDQEPGTIIKDNVLCDQSEIANIDFIWELTLEQKISMLEKCLNECRRLAELEKSLKKDK